MPGNLIDLFLLLCCTVNLSAISEKNDSTFVPSSEWQPIKKGQPIPSGLHVRHNFQTGLTEAKLLDNESQSNSDDDQAKLQAKSLTLHPDESIRSSEDDVFTNNDKKHADDMKISLEELKARLKKIKLLDNEIQSGLSNEPSDGETQDRFKSYKNLKNEFKALEVNITTDAEMLATFFQRFETHRDSIATESLTNLVIEDVLQILNNFEYLLHQIDNAHTFADMGGMAKVISPCFNATNDEIKAEALRLLGTAVQSNPKVQAKALEHDFVQKLLHILAVNNKVTVQSRCLFALSALIRQYPVAQKALIDHGGLEIFGKILEDGHPQTQSRVMKLVTDLVQEKKDLNYIEDDVIRRQKNREYTITNFDNKLLTQNYCKHLSKLMIRSFSNGASGDSSMEDYDFLTVILDNMIVVGSICKRDFRDDKYPVAVASAALHHYKSIKDSSSEDDAYSLTHLISLLVKLVTSLQQEESHDEL